MIFWPLVNMKFSTSSNAALRWGSVDTVRTYTQLKLTMGYESAPWALVNDAAKLSYCGASTALQAASRLAGEALMNFPAAFFTRPYGMLFSRAYCSSTNPMEPGSLRTLSAMSELRSVDVPTGQAGEMLRPTWSRNFGLVFERKSVKM